MESPEKGLADEHVALLDGRVEGVVGVALRKADLFDVARDAEAGGDELDLLAIEHDAQFAKRIVVDVRRGGDDLLDFGPTISRLPRTRLAAGPMAISACTERVSQSCTVVRKLKIMVEMPTTMASATTSEAMAIEVR